MQMSNHKYCCQNTTQNYLDHIITIPEDFNVNPNCLFGLSKEDFIDGLKSLTEIIKSIYSDIVNIPAEYGLPLVEDIEYKPFNPKAAESKNSAHRLITLLYTLVQCGEFSENKIVVDKKLFSDTIKKLKTIYKASNVNMILKKLCDFRFIIDGFNGKTFDKNSDVFTLSYADGGDVISVLYGFMKNTPLKKQALFSLNYFLAIPQNELPNNNHQMIFAQYLSGNERVFYTRLNEHIIAAGLVVGNADDYSNVSFGIEYLTNAKANVRLVACYSDYGKLQVRLRARRIEYYTEWLETLPEQIKRIFRVKSNCRSCQKDCGYKNAWTFEGVEYTLCGYQQYFDIADYNLGDIDYYKQIIQYEIEHSKNKKKTLPCRERK